MVEQIWSTSLYICITIMGSVISVGLSANAADALPKPGGGYSFPPVDKLPVQEGLADPFLKPDGTRVKSKEEWAEQREYLKAMLAHYQYGTMPPRPKEFDLKCVNSMPFFDGKALKEQYAITLERNGKTTTFHFELIRPSEGKRMPAIIKLSPGGFKVEAKHLPNADVTAALEAVSRGYLICMFKCLEVAPDSPNKRDRGVFLLYPEFSWGTIAAWAWAFGIVADALDRLEVADMERLVYTGHSRGGKTALCAGIYDERVAITAPNSSGTGGTGGWRYFKGKRPQNIASHVKRQHMDWWGKEKRILEFIDREDRLPFDAHTAKALIAPRGLINPHARQDSWANPHGTELTYRAADMVFEWLGAKGKQGIHWRDGKHAQNEEDWLALFDFADLQFFNKKPKRSFTALTYPDAKVPVSWKVPSR